MKKRNQSKRLWEKLQGRNNLSENQIAMYSTLAQFKSYLWIDVLDTSHDVLLTQILNSAEMKLNHLCWVDSFEKWKRTQTIESRWIFDTARWLEFYLKNKPVESIDSMNWETYEWEKWTDYLIIYDRRAIFKKLNLNDRWMIEVEYTAWYETIPDDLKLLEMMLWCAELPDSMKSEYWVWLSSYKLWDEQITFWVKSYSNWNSWMTSDDICFSFTALLDKYKNFNLPL